MRSVCPYGGAPCLPPSTGTAEATFSGDVAENESGSSAAGVEMPGVKVPGREQYREAHQTESICFFQ